MQAYRFLDAREKEIKALRDGLVHPVKQRSSTPATKTEAFEKYLKLFYDRPKHLEVKF